jgi:hypothetical protein
MTDTIEDCGVVLAQLISDAWFGRGPDDDGSGVGLAGRFPNRGLDRLFLEML